MAKQATANKPKRALERIADRFAVPSASLNYLVNYDPERRIAYVETPKVACTAIKAYMQERALENLAETDELMPARSVHDRAASPLPMLKTLSDEEQRAVLLGKVRRFGFVRNPYTRTLSAYLDKIVQSDWERSRHLPRLGFAVDAHVSFVEFLRVIRKVPEAKRDIHFARQSRLLAAGDIGYAFLGAFERFDKDFAEVKRRFYDDVTPVQDPAVGRQHATNASEKLAAHFGPEEVMLVEEIYRADFEIFGYPKDLKHASAPPQRQSGPLPASARISAQYLNLPNPAQSPSAFGDALRNLMTQHKISRLRGAELGLRGAFVCEDPSAAQALHELGLGVLKELGMPLRVENEAALWQTKRQQA